MRRSQKSEGGTEIVFAERTVTAARGVGDCCNDVGDARWSRSSTTVCEIASASTTVGLCRPSNGYWYMLLSSTNDTAFIAQPWGVSTDIPVLE